MKTLLILLMSASALLALDDPTLPIHENGEYLCYVKGPDGKAQSCQLWLLGKRLNNNLFEAYKLKKFGKYVGGAVATTGGMPVGEYEKEPVILNLDTFYYMKLIRIKRPRPESRSSLHDWNKGPKWDKFTNWTNEVVK
jgi:hypothetical protein